jgi:hypothetical protein
MASENAPSTSLQVKVIGPVHNVLAEWDSFRKAHSAWPAKLGDVSVAYCLPDAAINTLAKPFGNRKAFFGELLAAAELDFSKFCTKHHAVGWWQRRHVVHGLLQRSSEPGAEDMQRAGWTSQQQGAARELIKKADEAAHRCKGVMGWLLTEPAFIAEAASLHHEWLGLPSEYRPTFPFLRTGFADHPRAATPPSGVKDYWLHLGRFLDRWGLIGMATWDLPLPQGPLMPTPLPLDARAMPEHGVHIVLPIHYPIQGDDDLLKQIHQSQQQRARELGLNESFSALRHYRAYSNMFDVLHLERAILSRTGESKPPFGFRLRVQQAIAGGLNLSTEAVQAYCKMIAACRKGNRSSIGRLNARTR